MTAIWTPPRTWTTGEIVTAAMLNEQVRDNLLWLMARGLTPTSDFDGTVGSTTSSSFTDIGNSFSLTTVKANAVVLCVCSGTAIQGNNADTYNLTLAVDGTNIGDSSRGMAQLGAATNTTYTFALIYPYLVASAGAHTLKLQAKRSAGTMAAITITAMNLWAWELA